MVSAKFNVSTHSRPKAAGENQSVDVVVSWFQHTAARRRLVDIGTFTKPFYAFQHTAARRRLVPTMASRPLSASFNTQPPEGGWGHNLCPLQGY